MTIWALRKVLSCSSRRRCIEALCKRPAVLELKVLQALDPAATSRRSLCDCFDARTPLLVFEIPVEAGQPRIVTERFEPATRASHLRIRFPYGPDSSLN